MNCMEIIELGYFAKVASSYLGIYRGSAAAVLSCSNIVTIGSSCRFLVCAYLLGRKVAAGTL